VPRADERYYDLCGAVGYVTTTIFGFCYPALRDRALGHVPAAPWPVVSTFAPRQLILTAALGIWSVRLGSFLFQRAMKAGGDSRFDEIKHQPTRFAVFWLGQGRMTLLRHISPVDSFAR
jgi:Protein of unknown function (DUF1295)